MRTGLILALLLAVSASGVTMAQAQGRRGTAVEQDACARDVTRLCRRVMNDGDMVVLGCLQQNRAKLSRGCRRVLEEHGQ